MQGKVNKSSSPIGRVKCVVNSCYYHQSGDQCMAEKIEVNPPNASSSQDTDCNTFTPKSSM
jgi:hypothetical protein